MKIEFDFDNCSIDTILEYAKKSFNNLVEAGKIKVDTKQKKKKKKSKEVNETNTIKTVNELATIEVEEVTVDIN